MTTDRSTPVSDYELRGRRTKAAWIDVVIVALIGLALLVLLGNAHTIHTSTVINGQHSHSTATLKVMSASGGLAWLGVSLLYYFSAELLWGQTLGKRLMRVRVTTVSGDRPSSRAIFVRTVGRMVDFLPFWYLGGWLVMRGGERPFQRVGDRLAGTTVNMVATFASQD